MKCPLCEENSSPFYTDSRERSYFRCDQCQLVFLEPRWHLSPESEQGRYQEHENYFEDAGYRNFLSRLTDAMEPHLSEEAEGLDYGSGPEPVIQKMMEQKGYSMGSYDPFFAPDKKVLQKKYDFISCSEAAEHFFSPRKEFETFYQLLKPGGLLGVMTEERIESQSFAKWYYKNDPTHVCFYSRVTMEWVAQHFGWQLRSPRKNVFLFF